MVVPEPFCCTSYDVVVAKPSSVVIQKRKFVLSKDIGIGLSIQSRPNTSEVFFKELREALVNSSFAVLGNVNSLAKGKLPVASYIFCVPTHVG